MRFVKKFFSKTAHVIIAGIIAAVPVIAVSAFLISGTFAAGNDITETFGPVSDTYPLIAVNGTNNDVRGTKIAISSNVNVLTTDQTRIPPVLTGKAPGVAAVAYLTSIGTGRNITYQVYDPNGIAGYIIPGGKMVIASAGGSSSPLNVKLLIDTQNNGNTTQVSITDWNSGRPNNAISWKSLQPGIATVDAATGAITAVSNGSASIIGTVTDKWGVKQTITILVSIGNATYVIDGGDGTYWLPGDKPNTYYEADQNGKIKDPIHVIYDPDGPGTGVHGIDIFKGDDGKYYVPDDGNYPNIWREFDTDAGRIKPNGSTIWGGPDQAPGGKDDKNAVLSGGFYYANLGQNVYQKVDKDGYNAGQILGNKPIGGGGDSTPGTADDLNNIILGIDGRYYSGPYADGYYIGDKPANAGGNNQLNTSGSGPASHADPIADTDQKWYMGPNGNMVAEKPVNPGAITGVAVVPGPVIDLTAGAFVQFSAEVTGTNNPSQAVTWTVGGNASPGTIISTDGILSIASDETSGQLRVTAASVADPAKTGVVLVNIRVTGAAMRYADSDRLTAGFTQFIIKDDGSLWGAGYNEDGQLGLGDTKKRLAWTPIMPGTKFKKVSEYTYVCDCHVLALAADGRLYAWGNNECGELGDGTTKRKSTPILIMPGWTFKDIATGCHFSMAVRSDGSVYSWGCNPYGELGNGRKSSYIATPGQITGLAIDSPVKAISAGEHFAAAIMDDGRLFMWGDNDYGQLGDNTKTDRTVPFPVLPTVKFKSVSIQTFGHTLALTMDGRLYTWGRNTNGQLGDGSKTTSRGTPLWIATDKTFDVICTGRKFSMALTTDGRLFTWGQNLYGQLGVGHKSDLTVPTEVTPGIRYMAIAAGEHNSMAVTYDGYLNAWGNNQYGQYGNGMSGTSSIVAKTIPQLIPLS